MKSLIEAFRAIWEYGAPLTVMIYVFFGVLQTVAFRILPGEQLNLDVTPFGIETLVAAVSCALIIMLMLIFETSED